MKIYGELDNLYITRNKSIVKKLEKLNILPINVIKKVFYCEYHYIDVPEIRKIVGREKIE